MDTVKTINEISPFYFTDIDECFNNPCINNAVSCKNTFGRYECNCQPGFAGRHCQTGRYNLLFFPYIPFSYFFKVVSAG